MTAKADVAGAGNGQVFPDPAAADRKFGVRIKDSRGGHAQAVHASELVPPRPAWRITAKYVPWDKPHVFNFDTVISGLQEQDSSPGYLSFTRDGKEYRLDPAADGSIVFRDQTAGKATYGAGRFLDIVLTQESQERRQRGSGL